MRVGLVDNQTRWRGLIVAGAGAVAAGDGVLIAINPVLGLGLAGLVGLAALLSLGKRLPAMYLKLQMLVLLGYALFNRGFAHFGHNPIYIGDLTLMIGLLAGIMTLPRVRIGIVHVMIFIFMGWGLLRTLPYWSTYRFDALRDGVLWYYGIFAIVLSFVLTKERFLAVVGWYRRFIPYFLYWVPFGALLGVAFASHLPSSIDGQVPFIVFNAGGAAVTLTGIAAFLLAGLASDDGFSGGAISSALIWPLWILEFLICSAMSRAAFLAAGVASGVAYALYPTKRVISAFVVGGALLSVLLIINPTVDLGGFHRTLSIQQFTDNIASIAGKENSGDLQGTKSWRLDWWNEIIDYTFHGPFFWEGKGFGVNLATSDGITGPESSLRAPHNGHLDILARMGVPGFAFWIILQLTIGGSFIRGFIMARRHGQPFWAKVQVWLLAYWLANMINASFDVYLESPQGGILFWCVIGFGMAAQRLQRADYETGEVTPAPEHLVSRPGGEPRPVSLAVFE